MVEWERQLGYVIQYMLNNTYHAVIKASPSQLISDTISGVTIFRVITNSALS